MKKFTKHQKVLINYGEVFKKYCPNTTTVEEFCEGDEVNIAAVCKALGCRGDEELITPDEAGPNSAYTSKQR